MQDKKTADNNPAQRGRRLEWLDTAKMLTMILVVIGHAVYTKNDVGFGQIGATVGVEYRPGWVALISYLCSAIYSFHMPAFFMLAGVSMAIARPVKNLKELAGRRARRLLVPFVLVTSLYLVPMKVLAGMYDKYDHPFLVGLWGNISLTDCTHLWFLPVLFCVSVIFYLLLRYVYPRSRVVFWLILSALQLIYILKPKDLDFSENLILLSYYCSRMSLYYAIGYFGWQRLERLRLPWPWVLLSWCLFVGAIVVVMRLNDYTLTGFVELVFTVWGVVNLVLSTHALRKLRIVREGRLARSLTKNGYDIYLYSDPFNYLIIAGSIVLWGYEWMYGSVYAGHTVFRILAQFVWAYLVIYAVSLIVKLYRGITHQD